MTQTSRAKITLKQNASVKLAGVLILAGGMSSRMGTAKAQLTLPTGETLLDYHVRQASQLVVPISIADNDQGFAVSADTRLLLDQQNISLTHVLDYQPMQTETSLNSHAHANASPSLSSNFSPNRNTKDIIKDDTKDNTKDHTKNNDPTKPKSSIGPLGAILAGLLQCLNDTAYEEGSTNAAISELKSKIQSSQTKKVEDNRSHGVLVISCDSLVSAVNVWQLISDANLQNLASPANAQVLCLEGKDSADQTRLYPLLGVYDLSIATELQAYLEAGERRVMGFTNPKCQPITMPEAWYDLANLNTPADFQRACQKLSALAGL